MIKKSVFDMKFVTPRQPVPTVEMNMDSLPENPGGYSSTAIGALADFARKNPKARATIYVYQGMSINFHKHTFSAFFGVAATQRIQEQVLRVLYNAFGKFPGVDLRMSDHINHRDGLMEFHIEDGCVWEAVDATAWYTNCGDSNEEAV